MSDCACECISLAEAFINKDWVELCATDPNRFVKVRMTYEDLKRICDLAEKQRKQGE